MPATTRLEQDYRRERVHALTAQGLPAHRIADQLHIHERTVVNYRRRLPPQLGGHYHDYRANPFDDPDKPPACHDHNPELWFPKPGDRRTRKAATEICHTCPVEGACLVYALATDARFGIWGGLSESQRTKISGKRP